MNLWPFFILAIDNIYIKPATLKFAFKIFSTFMIKPSKKNIYAEIKTIH